MFPIVSKKYQFVVGVDTHAAKHVATIIDSRGAVIASREIRVTAQQMSGFINWVRKVTSNAQDVLLAVEGTSSYGETLTRLAQDNGLTVTEVKPPKTKSRGGDGKTDLIDSELAARSVLHLPVNKLVVPRAGGVRKSLRILLASRDDVVTRQTADKNTLIALLRGCDLGIDARKALTLTQHQTISRWQTRSEDDQEQAVVRHEAKRLACSILSANLVLEENARQLSPLVNSLAPDLTETRGIGPVTAAQVLCAYSHKGRVHSPAAFAALAGTSPVSASSGKVERHRLNRYGDRELNKAIHTVALTRMRMDETTKEYMAMRTAQGQSPREIRRSLKRYIARSLFKQLEAYDIQP
jgi:transposase